MNTLYDDVIATTNKHLGPAADRFVARQIRSHLRHDPAELRRQDLHHLLDWIQLAMRLVTNDSHRVDRYMIALESLTQPKKPRTHGREITD